MSDRWPRTPPGRRPSTTSPRSTPATAGDDGGPPTPPTRTRPTAPGSTRRRPTACESTRHAERAAAPLVLRRFLAPSDTRLWRVLALLRRRVPEAVDPEATGINRGSSPSWARASRSSATSRELGARLADAGDPDGRCAPRDRQAGRLRRPRAGGPGRRRRDALRAARIGSGCDRATRWSTPAPPSSPPRRPTSTRRTPPPGRRPRRRRSRAPRRSSSARGPVRIGQGIEFDYCAVQAAESLRARWAGRR